MLTLDVYKKNCVNVSLIFFDQKFTRNIVLNFFIYIFRKKQKVGNSKNVKIFFKFDHVDMFKKCWY